MGAGADDRSDRLLDAVPGRGHLQLRADLRPARLARLHPGPAAGEPGHRLRQQPVHRHRCVSVRQPAPARGHWRDRDADAGATPSQLLHRRGGIAGVNQTPWTINITFNGPISPNTINANTVTLVDLGSNPSQPLDQDINLAGKLSYDSATDTLIINLAAAGLTLGTDAYQITLFGSGSPVLTNPQGVALDGENTVGGTSTGAQLALPSGNGYPGGNFFDSFIINTTPPSVQAGSLTMDPASDTNIVGDNITIDDLPTFDGTISEPNPHLVPVGRPDRDPRYRHRYVQRRRPTSARSCRQPANLDQFIRPNAGTAHLDDRRRLLGHRGDGRSQYRARDEHHRPARPVRHLQRRSRRHPVAAARRRQRLLRGARTDHRPERQPVQSRPIPTPSCRSSSTTRRPRSPFTSPTAGQVITSLTSGVLKFTITTSKNIDLTHFNAQLDQSHQRGPRRHPRRRRRRHDPDRSQLDQGDLPRHGHRRPGRRADHVLVAAGHHADQQPLPAHPPEHRRRLGPRHRRQRCWQPGSADFAVYVPSLATEPVRRRRGRPHHGDRQPEEPVRDDRRGHDGGVRGRRHRGAPRRVPGTGHDEAVREAATRPRTASTDSTVFTTSTGDALSTIIRAPFVGSPPGGNLRHDHRVRAPELHRPDHRDRRLHDRQPAGRRPGHRHRSTPIRRRQHHRTPTSLSTRIT